MNYKSGDLIYLKREDLKTFIVVRARNHRKTIDLNNSYNIQSLAKITGVMD